jgi:N-6 DNA Methylase
LRYGVPPAGNANFAWLQYFINHLAPHDYAGFVLANGSLSSQQSREGERTVARAMDRRARARRRRVPASLGGAVVAVRVSPASYATSCDVIL